MAEKDHIVEAVAVEVIGLTQEAREQNRQVPARDHALRPAKRVTMHSAGKALSTPVYHRDELRPGDRIDGPASVIEAGATTVVELGWQAEVNRS